MKEWRGNEKLFKETQLIFCSWKEFGMSDTEWERFSTRNFLLEFINIHGSGMVWPCLWKWEISPHSPACILDLLGTLALFTISLLSSNIVRLAYMLNTLQTRLLGHYLMKWSVAPFPRWFLFCFWYLHAWFWFCLCIFGEGCYESHLVEHMYIHFSAYLSGLQAGLTSFPARGML